MIIPAPKLARIRRETIGCSGSGQASLADQKFFSGPQNF